MEQTTMTNLTEIKARHERWKNVDPDTRWLVLADNEIIGHYCLKPNFATTAGWPANWTLEPRPTKEEIALLEMVEKMEAIVLAEYRYWSDSDCDASVSAVGALSNVLAAFNGHTPTHHCGGKVVEIPPEEDDDE